MSGSGRQAEIRTRTEELLSRSAEREAGERGDPGRSPEPGDLFVFEEAEGSSVLWAVIDRDPAKDRPLLAVAADTHPLAGSGDVPVPPGAPGGALTLHCRHSMWLDADDLEAGRPAGVVDSETVERALHKHADLARGEPVGTLSERDTDADPEYEDLDEELAVALAAMRERRREREAHRVATFRPPASRWASINSPLGLAAAVLLMVSIGLGSGLFWQVRQGRLLRQSYEHRVAGEASERQRLEQSYEERLVAIERRGEAVASEYQQQIRDLEGRLAEGRRIGPRAAMPFGWLSPFGTRGDPPTIQVPTGAEELGIVLQIDDPEFHERYRLDIEPEDGGRRLWRSGVLTPAGAELLIVLPRSMFSSGDYRLKLYGLRGDDAAFVGEYAVRLAL